MSGSHHSPSGTILVVLGLLGCKPAAEQQDTTGPDPQTEGSSGSTTSGPTGGIHTGGTSEVETTGTSAVATTGAAGTTTGTGTTGTSGGPDGTDTGDGTDTSDGTTVAQTTGAESDTGIGPYCDQPDENGTCFTGLPVCCQGCDPECPDEPIGPAQTCEGPKLCDDVWLTLCDGDQHLLKDPILEDPAAAQCFLSALRDRKQGFLRLLWGDPHGYGTDGAGFYEAEIFSRGDGTVLIVAAYSIFSAGPLSFEYFVSNTIVLRDAAWFADCVMEDSDAGKVECLVVSEDRSLSSLPWLLPMCADFTGC